MKISIKSDLELDSLRKWVRSKLLPAVNISSKQEVIHDQHFKDLSDLGFLTCGIPGKFKGPGLTMSHMIDIAREISYGSAGIALSTTVTWFAQAVLDTYANDLIKDKVYSNCLNEMALLSFCMTEPNAGTDVRQIETRAVQKGDRFLISGEKCFITNASLSSHLIVFARVENPKRGGILKDGISAFYVPGNSQGLTRGSNISKLGLRESNTGGLFFDQVEVPQDHLLGEVGQGLKILNHCIQWSKTLLAAICSGIGDRVFDLLSEYLRGRRHYGKSLIDLPTIRCQIAEHQTETQAAWLLTCLAANLLDSGQLAVKEASMAKDYCSNVIFRFASEALELFGSYGYTTEFEIERLFRDARAFKIVEGASLVQKSIIAKELFGNPTHESTVRSSNKKASAA